jgi:hypothetical protein
MTFGRTYGALNRDRVTMGQWRADHSGAWQCRAPLAFQPMQGGLCIFDER